MTSLKNVSIVFYVGLNGSRSAHIKNIRKIKPRVYPNKSLQWNLFVEIDTFNQFTKMKLNSNTAFSTKVYIKQNQISPLIFLGLIYLQHPTGICDISPAHNEKL